MTNLEIETALGQRLAEISDLPPVAWPNANYDPKPKGAVPYIEFVHAPVQRVDDTIDASDPRQEGLCLITVVVERGKFTNLANTLAETIAGQFLNGLRIEAGDGAVMMSKPSDIIQGFTDGIYWRVPVRVTYRTVRAL